MEGKFHAKNSEGDSNEQVHQKRSMTLNVNGLWDVVPRLDHYRFIYKVILCFLSAKFQFEVNFREKQVHQFKFIDLICILFCYIYILFYNIKTLKFLLTINSYNYFL